VGGHSLGNPVAVLPAWLQHLTRLGATVPAGTVVTTGAWGGLHALSAAAAAGALCELEFSGLAPLRFSAAAG
jgi:2-keto-4-pentenoate hydratase